MDTRLLVLSLILAGVPFVASGAAGQHESHQAGVAAAPSAAQVVRCRQVQPVLTELLNAALRRLEEARLTNSAAAMRDAADDVQAALLDMRTQLAPCGEMQLAAEGQAGHTMPSAQTSPTGPAGLPVTRPGAPAPAEAVAHPHAGHAMPGAPQTPAARAPRTPSTSATRPSAAAPRSPGPAPSDTHAEPGKLSTSSPKAAAAGRTTAAASPPTSLADLKCANAVDQKRAPRMLYKGRMYYFCTEASRADFAKDPGRFVTVPPQAAPAHGH